MHCISRFLSKVIFIILLPKIVVKTYSVDIWVGVWDSHIKGAGMPPPPPPPGIDNFNGVTEDAIALTLLKVAFGPGDSILKT